MRPGRSRRSNGPLQRLSGLFDIAGLPAAYFDGAGNSNNFTDMGGVESGFNTGYAIGFEGLTPFSQSFGTGYQGKE